MHSQSDRRGKAITIAVLTLMGWVSIVHLGWNLALPDLLGVAEIRFRQALGLVLLLGAIVAPFRARHGAIGSPGANGASDAY